MLLTVGVSPLRVFGTLHWSGEDLEMRLVIFHASSIPLLMTILPPFLRQPFCGCSRQLGVEPFRYSPKVGRVQPRWCFRQPTETLVVRLSFLAPNEHVKTEATQGHRQSFVIVLSGIDYSGLDVFSSLKTGLVCGRC